VGGRGCRYLLSSATCSTPSRPCRRPRDGTGQWCGQHKAEVERELPSLGSDCLILRLSKIYGLEKGDGTLLDEMAQQLAARREIRAARDQVFCPTYVADLVAAVHAVQAKKLRGTCNACNPERWSRLDIALGLADAMGADWSLVKPITLRDLTAMAGRPLDTSIDPALVARSAAALRAAASTSRRWWPVACAG
jgi:dTDP-4-dehydrorhamnose reductase